MACGAREGFSETERRALEITRMDLERRRPARPALPVSAGGWLACLGSKMGRLARKDNERLNENRRLDGAGAAPVGLATPELWMPLSSVVHLLALCCSSARAISLSRNTD